jgi:hypothetical protein
MSSSSCCCNSSSGVVVVGIVGVVSECCWCFVLGVETLRPRYVVSANPIACFAMAMIMSWVCPKFGHSLRRRVAKLPPPHGPLTILTQH